MVAFVLLLLLGCGGSSSSSYNKTRMVEQTDNNGAMYYAPETDGFAEKYTQPENSSRSNLVQPMNSYKNIYPKPVANRRNCFGYVNRNGECWGNLHVPSTGMQRCYGDLEGGDCSGPVF